MMFCIRKTRMTGGCAKLQQVVVNTWCSTDIPWKLMGQTSYLHDMRKYAISPKGAVTLTTLKRLSAASTDQAPAGLGDKPEFRGNRRKGESRWQARAPHTTRTATVRYVADQASSC
jgi:hypothetical protein